MRFIFIRGLSSLLRELLIFNTIYHGFTPSCVWQETIDYLVLWLTCQNSCADIEQLQLNLHLTVCLEWTSAARVLKDKKAIC